MKSKLLLVVAVGALFGVSFLLKHETDRDRPLPPPKKATFKPGKTAEVETSKGTFKFVLYQKDMPRTTKNFLRLTGEGFYDGNVFHRYEPGFVIQGGRGREGQPMPPEIEFESRTGMIHKPGTVAMARIGDDFDSASSEFYVCLKRAEHLDGGYAVFGQVTSGMDVVEKLREGDKIQKIRIVPTPRE